MTMQPGQVLNNRYRIVKILGAGGMGRVYRAWDLNLKNSCALKENLDLSPESTSQFEQEAMILANLHHPHLPRVIDTFQIPGQGQYLVMDYVEGENLESLMERAASGLPAAQALPWVLQICDALTYLHTHKPPVIHRDIKPANIKINPNGDAILVDFGISKIYTVGSQTTRGARAATPGYAPPEQFGLGNTDERSDIYALGATLYHLLTGQVPPSALDVVSGGAAHPSPVNQVNPVVSPRLSAAIERAMQLNRVNRFATAAEFAAALRSAEQGNAVPGAVEMAQSPPARPAQVVPFPVPSPDAQDLSSGSRTPTPAPAEPPASPPRVAPPLQAAQGYVAVPASQPDPAYEAAVAQTVSKSSRNLPLTLFGGGVLVTLVILAVLGYFIWRLLSPPVTTPTAAPVEPTAVSEISPTEAPAAELAPTEPPQGATAVGPAEQPTEAPASGGGICASGQTYHLTLWHDWFGDLPAFYEAVAKDYSSLNPCVTIEFSNPSDLNQQLIDETAAGGGPDLVSTGNDRIGNLLEKRVIADLNQFGVGGSYMEATFEPVAARGVTLDGAIYGLPEVMDSIALIYNRSLDLDAFLPTDPQDFFDLLDKAAAYKAERGQDLVCNSGMSNGDAYFATPVFFGFGVPEYIDSSGTAYLDTTEALNAGEWMQKFREVSSADADYLGCQDQFTNGRVGMWWNGLWSIQTFLDQGMDVGVVSMGRPYVSSRAFMLTKVAVTRGVGDAAIDFMKYATSADVQSRLAESNVIIPANLVAASSSAIAGDPIRQAFLEQARLGVPYSNHIYTQAQWTPVSEAIKSIWNGTLSPQEALQLAQEKILEEIARINGG